MASAGSRPDRHKTPPIPFRPPAEERERFLAHVVATGKPVNQILRQAVREYLERVGDGKPQAERAEA